jgi:pyridoxamine 5'-phosphate oxidase
MASDSHYTDLTEILQHCWQHLERGVKNRRSGFHFPVVSTVDLFGKPKGRVVILREVNAEQKTLRFNSDLRTLKWKELAAQPAISLTLYDESERIQLRVEGSAVLHIGNDVAKAAWNNSQRMSRVGYGAVPGPGMQLSAADAIKLPTSDEDIEAGFENFGTIVVRVETIEWLYLKTRGNHRALFDLSTNTAQWLAP